MKPAPDPTFPQVRGQFGSVTGLNVVVELEHRKGCWPVSVISGKYSLTCGNVDSDGWAKSADFGPERISCGIPAESRGAPSSVEDDREHAIVDQSPREARASLNNRNKCSGSVGDGLNPRVA